MDGECPFPELCSYYLEGSWPPANLSEFHHMLAVDSLTSLTGRGQIWHIRSTKIRLLDVM